MHDLVIIGAGPAGLSASVYASRYGIKNIIVGEVPGGLPNVTHEIGNWLGTSKISGYEFCQKALEHAKSLGAALVSAKADQIVEKNGIFEILLSNNEKISTKSIILAMGTRRRQLSVPGEKDLIGKGISYCATCDGFFYKNKVVAVIGGNDSAAQAAVYLSDIAQKIYLIYRKDKIRAEDYWIKLLESSSKVEIIYNTNIKEFRGSDKLNEVLLDNPYQNSPVLKLDGVFIEIGLEPNTVLTKNLGIDLDEEGHIKISSNGKTSARGIWAAGDITDGSDKFKQIVTAAAEGAIAVRSIQQYLKNN